MNILSFADTHDSSACVIKNGELKYFIKEERLTRTKRDHGCFLALLDIAKNYKEKIDVVLYHRILNMPFTDNVFTGRYDTFVLFAKKLFKPKLLLNYSSLNHHDCHASLSFYNSGFEKSLVLVADAGGSCYFYGNYYVPESESIYLFEKGKQKTILQKNFFLKNKFKNIKNELSLSLNESFKESKCEVNFNSIGLSSYYSTACGLFNENILEAGKAMGLSSYGDSDPFLYFKDKLHELSFEGENCLENDSLFGECNKNYEHFTFPKSLKRTEKVTRENFKLYANYCKLVQVTTEEKILELVKKHVHNTNIKNVCLSGGYTNNIVTNAFLKKNLPEVNFYFEPVCDDSGISIGAAYDYYTNLDKDNFIDPPKNNFYISYKKETLSDLRLKPLSINELLNLFLNQKTIAIFDGQPEAGQRALGHRSIIFDARNLNGKDIVNVVKKREWYRPFAGVVRKEDFKNYFYDMGFDESPDMMINFDAKKHTCEEFPSIIHVDNTCRIQTVTEGFFYNFITLLKEKTGCPIILNTSFNLAGEPLVHSVEDAIRTFDNSNLDVLYFVEDKKALIK